MNSFSKIILCITIAFATQIQAQQYNLPRNPDPGKCYERCFDYDKKFEWVVVDCKEVTNKFENKTEQDRIKEEQEKLKMTTYQEKLLSLGYKVEITGIADSKTIEAHHKYLKARKKQEKKKKKLERKLENNN